MPAVRAPVRTRFASILIGYGALALAACLLAPLAGSTHISLMRAFDQSIPFPDNVDAQIFFVARMPRVLTGAIVGSTLAAAGVVMQALLGNPLATPFTLGVSTGAAFASGVSDVTMSSAMVMRVDLRGARADRGSSRGCRPAG